MSLSSASPVPLLTGVECLAAAELSEDETNFLAHKVLVSKLEDKCSSQSLQMGGTGQVMEMPHPSMHGPGTWTTSCISTSTTTQRNRREKEM